MKKREGIILLGYLENIDDGGKTSRRIAKEAVKRRYIEPPVDRSKVSQAKVVFQHLRSDGRVKVLNEKRGRGPIYRYTLTNSGWSYYEWLKEHYKEKTSRFPPEEV